MAMIDDARGALSTLPSPGAALKAVPARGALAAVGLVAVLVVMTSTFGLAGLTMTMMGLALVTFAAILAVTSAN
jgi:hypothetical protein